MMTAHPKARGPYAPRGGALLGASLLLISLALLAPACSSLGSPGSFPDRLPHGGTGQFRALTPDELLGLSGPPDGRAQNLQDRAFVSANVTEGRLFYAYAPPLADAPPEPDGWPAGEIDFTGFEPIRISVGEASEPGNPRFERGDRDVLVATQDWEGGQVFDPCVVRFPDRSVRMYYAGRDGIGVADAPSILDDFRARGAAPILDASASADGVTAPRRPSLVTLEDGTYALYFDAGGAIGVATSQDGLSFNAPSILTLEPPLEVGEAREVSVGMPSAVTVVTSAGRFIVRLYFEVVLDDGSHTIAVAGSEDGFDFTRHDFPVLGQDDRRAPAPVVVDRTVTLLYSSAPYVRTERNRRTLAVGVAPTTVSFLPPDAE